MVENVENNQALSVSTNFDNLSDAELMRLTGQTDGGSPSGGSVLSRLSITTIRKMKMKIRYREDISL